MRSATPTGLAVVAILAAFALPAGPGSAQEPAPSPGPVPEAASSAPPVEPMQPPDSVREMYEEFQTLQAHVGQVQVQAIEGDSALEVRRVAIAELVTSAMKEAHPGLDADLERVAALEQEFGAAHQANDTTALQRIVEEGQRIHTAVEQAEETALTREDVSREVEAFQNEVLGKMKEIEPGIDGILERMRVLGERLESALRGAGPAA